MKYAPPQWNKLRPSEIAFRFHPSTIILTYPSTISRSYGAGGASTAHGRQRVVTGSGLASTERNVLKKFGKVNTEFCTQGIRGDFTQSEITEREATASLEEHPSGRDFRSTSPRWNNVESVTEVMVCLSNLKLRRWVF